MGHEGRAGVKDGKGGDGMIIRSGVSLKERQPSTELRRRLGIEAIGDVMRRCRLRWHGQWKERSDADKSYARFVVEGKAARGRPGRTLCLPTCVC